jgi:type I restriction enzyme, S subunit
VNELPQSWAIADLGTVFPISYGKALAAKMRQDQGEYQVFGSNGVVGKHNVALTKGRAVIVGRKGAAGAVHFASEPCWVIDTAYYAERNDVLDLKFAGYLLDSMSLGKLDRSTAIPSLSRDDYSAVQVPIPPRSEQQRIVQKLDELLSDLESGVSALERARANLKRYRAAVLKAAVEGRLTEKWRAAHPDVEPASKLLERILTERRKKWEAAQIKKYADKSRSPPKGWKDKYPEPVRSEVAGLPELPKGWCWATVEQLVARSEYGTSVKCGYDAAHEPVLRIPNIAGGRIDLSDMKRATSPLGLSAEDALQPGDLLVCRTNGSVKLVGQAALVENVLDHVHSFASYLLRLRFVHGIDAARWVWIYLSSQRGRSFIEAHAASSAGQHNVSLSLLHGMPIPLAPLDEQRVALAEVDRVLSVQQTAIRDADRRRSHAAVLRQAILKRAFQGKLVPQDPKDEPASALLARIRAGKEAGKGLIGQDNRPRKIRRKIRTI